MSKEELEIQEVLNELNTVRPEMLNDKSKRLFEAIMGIADERDKLNNIIKEVREYIENNKIYTNEKQEAYTLKNTWYGIELLEILEGGKDT